MTSKDTGQWAATIDNLMSWLHQAQLATNQHAYGCIDTAIDFANRTKDFLPVPTSIALTPDDGVALDWELGDDSSVTLEVLDNCLAEVTHFSKGRVVGTWQVSFARDV